MGLITLSYLEILLVFTSGWLMIGWPLYVATMYTHKGISYSFALRAAIIGVIVGMCLIGIALKFPVFVIIFASVMSGIATLLGMSIGLNKNSGE